MDTRLKAFADLIETVHRLRAPGGCPWDRAQTHQSLRQYVIEEAYEVLEVLDRIESPANLKDEKVRGAFREELGDLLMQVILHSEMTREEGVFDIYEVAATLNEKLIRRHPHVFGDVKADNAESAFESWEKQKAKEKAAKDGASSSVLDGLPKQLPALQRAGRMIEKVTKVGFQWSEASGPLDKIQEELGELREEATALDRAIRTRTAKDLISADEAALRERVEAELGDMLFALCNLAYMVKISPEDALRKMLQRFEGRFRHIETRLKEKGKTPDQSTLEEMDHHWNEAKALEKKNAGKGAPA